MTNKENEKMKAEMLKLFKKAAKKKGWKQTGKGWRQ